MRILFLIFMKILNQTMFGKCILLISILGRNPFFICTDFNRKIRSGDRKEGIGKNLK